MGDLASLCDVSLCGGVCSFCVSFVRHQSPVDCLIVRVKCKKISRSSIHLSMTRLQIYIECFFNNNTM